MSVAKDWKAAYLAERKRANSLRIERDDYKEAFRIANETIAGLRSAIRDALFTPNPR